MSDAVFKQLELLWEVVKDILRWAVSGGVGYFLDFGYSFFTKSKLDPNVILVIGVIFKYADYYWHRYNKDTRNVEAGKSMGIIPF